MSLIDRTILEWAWMSEKGYPDINNKNDLRVFESLFGFKLLSESAFEKQVRQQLVDKFPQALNTMGDDYRIANKGKIDANDNKNFSLLCRKSLNAIKKGKKIGKIGNNKVNGGWEPHLHIQLSLGLGQGKNWPGVCNPSIVKFWEKYCPNPAPFLGINHQKFKFDGVEKKSLIQNRKNHYSGNLKISYKEPLILITYNALLLAIFIPFL